MFALRCFEPTSAGPIRIRFAASYSVFSAKLSLIYISNHFILNDRQLAGPHISFQIRVMEKVRYIKQKKKRIYDKYVTYF